MSTKIFVDFFSCPDSGLPRHEANRRKASIGDDILG